ncbi:hypothetical protein BJV77DRAFT_956322 [Russula vinacea]|nr:hypothetical protein BJV77DRAFT_956322 [Russula vinacea]
MYNVVDETPVDACYAVKCDKCGKTTWAGCGKHVESVMSGIKEEDRCVCPR